MNYPINTDFEFDKEKEDFKLFRKAYLDLQKDKKYMPSFDLEIRKNK